jgi:hypothetical protein
LIEVSIVLEVKKIFVVDKEAELFELTSLVHAGISSSNLGLSRFNG